MLVSEAPQRLPLTIRSRCSSIRVRQPDRRVVLEWLHHQGLGDQAATRLDGVGGAPLTALREDSVEGLARRLPCFDAFAGVFEGRLDPLEVAENWATQLGDLELRWLFDWLAALIRLSMDLGAEAVVSHQDLLPRLESLARRGRRDFFFETQARFMDVLEALDGPCNRQLVFEVFLMDWASAPRT
jgi:DNA polymerase-3 subunit delta'